MSNNKIEKNLELEKTKIGYRQAITIAIISAVVSLATVFKDVMYSNETTERVDHVEENLPKEVDRQLNEKINATNGKITVESIPIGTVISSSLNYENFSKATNNGAIFNSIKSSWAPADGRSVEDSKYHQLTKNAALPDLRGQFVRGLNQFLPDGEPLNIINGADPDAEKRNIINGHSYQQDILKKHEHQYYAGTKVHTEKETKNQKYLIRPDWKTTKSDLKGTETRPKNIGVFFYIKIN